MTTDYQKEIREICTYYSELGEGTAGYSLSEEQFQKLFALLQQSNKETEEALLGHVELWLLRLHTEPDKWTVRQALRSLRHPEEVHTDPDLEGRI